MTGPIERALARATQTPSTPAPTTPLTVTNDGPQNAAPSPDDTAQQAGDDSSHSAHVQRRTVHVNTLGQRYAVTRWMSDYTTLNGGKHIASKAVREFPLVFTGNMKAKLQKASRWWAQRDATLQLKTPGKRLSNLTMASTRRNKRCNLKALGGRGRKRAKWVCALYEALLQDFERLRSAGVKFNTCILLQHARSLINSSETNSPFHHTVCQKGKPIIQCLTARWLQHFMSASRIVLRAQTGKLMVSPLKQAHIEKSVAFHLGILKRGFASGELQEDNMENADETHFVFNMDNGKTLGMIGDNDVKYADVVSGGEPITMMVRLSGGRHAAIHPPMLIFKNVNRSYPIRGVEDSVPGVCYRASPKGWMDSQVWSAWLSDTRAITALPAQRQRILYVDNCSSHVFNPTIESQLANIRTTLRKLPPNATNLVQPADSFIIQKVKDAWREKWDKYKYECITRGDWQDGVDGTGSGKLLNPGKKFFLKLAADSVRDVNNQRDKDGVSYARRAMIRTGMSLNLEGVWSEAQLTEDLQIIVAKYRNHFNGEPVCAADVETESDEDA